MSIRTLTHLNLTIILLAALPAPAQVAFVADGSGKMGFIVGPGRDDIAAFGPKMVMIPGN